MAFSYDEAAAGGRDELRAMVADTVSPGVHSDAEIDRFLARWSNDLNLAAAAVLRSLAVNQAKLAIYYQINGLTIDRRELSKLLLESAKQYAEAAKQAPYEYESALEYSTDAAGRDESNYMDTKA